MLRRPSSRKEQPAPESGLGERQLRLLVGLPFVAVGIAHSETRRWVRFNNKLCELTGYSPEELRRGTWPDLCRPEDRPACLGKLAKLISGEVRELEMVCRLMRKDGTTGRAEVNVRLGFPRGGGTPLLIVVLLGVSQAALAETADSAT
jgi:PAS domain S-box-containing protein